MGSRWIGAAIALLMSATLAMAEDKPQTPQAAPSQPAPKMSKETRFMLIRGINAERVFVRRTFPMGEKGLTLKNGVVTPDENQAKFIAAQYGPAARPGERAQITDVIVKDKTIIFEINGGPKKKKKWYQRIEVGGMGGTTPIAPDGNPQNPKGSFVVLVFDKYVPELSPQAVKDLLAPVFDFTALSATQAYIDSLPPKTREALKNGRVLVGMDREMVTVAKGRPDKKIRERDEAGSDYEEWMYGVPPKDVEFIRLAGNEVIQVKIMKVDGQKIVRTEREVDLPQTAAKQPGPAAEDPPAPRPANAPTLRRPGEAPEEPVGASSPSRIGIPPDTRPSPGPTPAPEPTPQPD
jgi:hypothetical protein